MVRDQIDKLKTFDDVVNLVKELLNWQKKEVEQLKKLPDFDLHKIAENYNLNNDEIDSDDSDETQSSSQSQSCDEGDESKDTGDQVMESNDEEKKDTDKYQGTQAEAHEGGGSGVAPDKLTASTNDNYENNYKNYMNR